MSTGISRDEWLKALGDAVKVADPDAFTINELCEMFGIGRQATYLRVKKLVEEKRAVATYKAVQTGSGIKRISAYKLVKPKK